MKDPYVYENTEILINKLNIRDEKVLLQAEADLTTQRLIDIDDEILSNKTQFDFKHIKKIHQYIFQDIYEWAGVPRTVNIAKPEEVLNGLSVEYTDKNFIEENMNKALVRLNEVDWKNLSLGMKSKEFTRRLADVWKVHPFREGNTRTIIKFSCQYAKTNGFPMKEELFKDYSNYVRKSLVLASIGEYAEYKYLERIIKDAIEQGQNEQIEFYEEEKEDDWEMEL